MKIRDDLEGVVFASLGGDVVVLKAGDTIPDGVDVGEHLTKKIEPKTEPQKGEEDDESGVKRGRSRSTRARSDS